MTWAEFERRYDELPERDRPARAELLNGVVYVNAAARNFHSRPHQILSGWLSVFEAATPGVEAAIAPTVRLDSDNAPEPDLSLRILPENGGSFRLDDKGYITGPVELAVEVASSSVARDLHEKREIYRRHGCAEYLVYIAHSGEVRWFQNSEGSFADLAPESDGVIRSKAFPGLWLDGAALASGDLARLHETVRRGLAAPEHASFVERLAERRAAE